MDWFPRMRAMSLIVTEDNENNMGGTQTMNGNHIAMGQYPHGNSASHHQNSASGTGKNGSMGNNPMSAQNGSMMSIGHTSSSSGTSGGHEQHAGGMMSNQYQMEFKNLAANLDQTNRLVNHLMHQLHELRDHVSVN